MLKAVQNSQQSKSGRSKFEGLVEPILMGLFTKDMFLATMMVGNGCLYLSPQRTIQSISGCGHFSPI
jgi:hypothetical protein